MLIEKGKFDREGYICLSWAFLRSQAMFKREILKNRKRIRFIEDSYKREQRVLSKYSFYPYPFSIAVWWFEYK